LSLGWDPDQLYVWLDPLPSSVSNMLVRDTAEPHIIEGKFWAGTLGKRCFGCGTPPTALLAETHCEFGFLCCNTPRAVNNHFPWFWTENFLEMTMGAPGST